MVQELMSAARTLRNVAQSMPALIGRSVAEVADVVTELERIAAKFEHLARSEAAPSPPSVGRSGKVDGRRRSPISTVDDRVFASLVRLGDKHEGVFLGHIARVIEASGYSRATVTASLIRLDAAGRITCIRWPRWRWVDGEWRW